jgi:3-deoxy-manno-octulosonate cytidylyltransferase (CMP-KDO synthetase)
VLLDIHGKPMLQWCYELAQQSGAVEVIIATDDTQVESACRAFGAHVALTSSDHRSGTDRIAEVVNSNDEPDDLIVVNLQADEPLLPHALIGQVAAALEQDSSADIATLCVPITTAAELHDPNVVKVVRSEHDTALYFSRAPIPWDRDTFLKQKDAFPVNTPYYRHVGLYAYRVSYLKDFTVQHACNIEQAESLEQLRALFTGHKIRVETACEPPGHGVDTQQDLDNVRALISKLLK